MELSGPPPLTSSTSFLLSRWHAIFVDTQARACAAGAARIARLPALRAASTRYLDALRSAAARAEGAAAAADGAAEVTGESDAAARLRGEADALRDEAESARTVAALWHCSEVAALYADADEVGDDAAAAAAGARGSPPLALLQWLRAHFWEPTSRTALLASVNALRAPGAALDSSVSDRAWNVVVKLALEGEPHDAGRLLSLVAAATRCRETAALGELLAAYPPLDAPSAHGAAHAAAWGAWARSVASFRASAMAGGQLVRHDARGFNPTACALLEVMSGLVWGEGGGATEAARTKRGLCALTLLGSPPLQDGTDATPYAQWHYLVGARILFGGDGGNGGGPLALPRSALASILSDSMRLAHMVVDERAPGGSNDDFTPAQLLHTFVRTIGGDSAATLATFPLYGVPWACAHLADLLWHAGALSSVRGEAMLLRGWDAPARAHMLLQHAAALSACALQQPTFARLGVSYILAATPEAALAVCGVSEGAVRSAMRITPPPGGAELALSLTHAEAGALGVPARIAQLAIFTGSCPAARVVLETALAAQPLSNELAALQAVALSQRMGCSGAAASLREQWTRHCLNGGEGGSLGTALAWGLSSADSSVGGAVFARLRSLLEEAIDSGLRRALHTVGGAGAVGSTGIRGAAGAWFPLQPLGGPSDCAHLLTTVCASHNVQLVDAALAAVGHGAVLDVDAASRQQQLTSSETLHRALSDGIPGAAHVLYLRALLTALEALLVRTEGVEAGGGIGDGDDGAIESWCVPLEAMPQLDAAVAALCVLVTGAGVSSDAIASLGEAARCLRLVAAVGLLLCAPASGANERLQLQYTAILTRVIDEERSAANALASLAGGDVSVVFDPAPSASRGGVRAVAAGVACVVAEKDGGAAEAEEGMGAPLKAGELRVARLALCRALARVS